MLSLTFYNKKQAWNTILIKFFFFFNPTSTMSNTLPFFSHLIFMTFLQKCINTLKFQLGISYNNSYFLSQKMLDYYNNYLLQDLFKWIVARLGLLTLSSLWLILHDAKYWLMRFRNCVCFQKTFNIEFSEIINWGTYLFPKRPPFRLWLRTWHKHKS